MPRHRPTLCGGPTLAELVETIGGTWVDGSTSAAHALEAGRPCEPRGEARATIIGPSAIDSRTVRPGEIFWALRGTRHDGNQFALDALRRGAAAAVVERIVEPAAPQFAVSPPAILDTRDATTPPADRPISVDGKLRPVNGRLIVVDDVPTALRRWAVHRRRCFAGVMIGVTGSAGKTTTRAMIDHLLGSCAQGTATPGNWNNELGVPLSLARLQPDDEYAVIEMGARQPGDIAHLAALVRPHWGVITCIGEAHLQSFGSREAIAQTKAELLAALPDDGLALLGDDDFLRRVARHCRCRVVMAGTSRDCQLRADRVEHRPGSLRFRLQGQRFDLPLWGEHHLTSALLAAGAAHEFGLAWSEIAARLAEFRPVAQRCQVFRHRGITIIDDSYNSSPSAAAAALKLLGTVEQAGRRIAVLGEMAELGDEAAALHWQLGKTAVCVGKIALLFVCGRNALSTAAGARQAALSRRRAIACGTADELLPYVVRQVRPGDAVLIKGSRVMTMERIVDALRAAPSAAGV